MSRAFSAIFFSFLFLEACGVRTVVSTSGATVINLSRQGLKEIPEEVFLNPDLKVLKFYGNQLDSVPARIAELTNLEKLYLGKNNIKSLPQSIGKLKKLKLLSAQYNELESLPESLGELGALEQIMLNQNKLKTIPQSIGQLKNLSVLQLKFNKLESLPHEIGNCTNLQFIHLTQNLLQELPPEIGQLRKLRELYLANAGMLLNLPDEMCTMRYLEVLEIDRSTVVPTCLLVQQTTRLQIIQR